LPTPPLPDEAYQSAVDAYQQALDSGCVPGAIPSPAKVAAESLKRGVDKFRRRYYNAREKGFKPGNSVKKDDSGPTFPRFSDDDIPVEEIIGHLKKRVIKKMARDQEERWYTINLPDDKPFGGLIFGDQHMGTHCNWPLLEEHCEIAKKTDGLYGINVGDLTDSWPLTGRLARLWADNDISLSTEWKLIDWFTAKAGITWLAYVLGNHDTFNTNALKVFEGICKDIVPVSEGEAKFIVRMDLLFLFGCGTTSKATANLIHFTE